MSAKQKLTLLLVDDHHMVRNGLKTMLELGNHDFFFEISTAETGTEAVNLIIKNDFKVALVDYQLPDMDGGETSKKLLEINPELKILGLSNYDEYNHVHDMIKAGAQGYALKNISSVELGKAINCIISGTPYFSPEINVKLANMHFKYLVQGADRQDSPRITYTKGESQKKLFSKRELQILNYITQELTNEQIAEKLKLSKRTVDNHRQNMIKKLNVNNTVGLIVQGLKSGIIEI